MSMARCLHSYIAGHANLSGARLPMASTQHVETVQELRNPSGLLHHENALCSQEESVAFEWMMTT